MGTLLASALIAQAGEIAGDEGNVVWSSPQALEWLNDAQRATVIVRPDASVITRAVKLNSGTRQTIQGLRLMSVIMNMGTDGLTLGRAIRLVERGMLDELVPNWHTATAVTSIKEYIFDERIPKEYYVSPPVHASTPVYVQVSESISPADVAATTNPITLDDIYAPAIITWMNYRYFSRDAEEVPDYQRAALNFQQFFLLLGKKIQMDMSISPKVRAHLE